MTTPRAISRKTGPFYFIRKSQSGYFFGRFRFFLFVASFASKCNLLDKDQSDFYHKDLIRVNQKQNLALSWFKPASSSSSKYECWCEFEKDLVAAQKNFKKLRGRLFPNRVSKPFYSRECFYFLRINVFPNLHQHLNFVVEVLMVLSNVKAWTQWNIVRSKFTCFFLALRLLWAMCKQKQFVKLELSFTTLYATIAWLENGGIQGLVYTSDLNASKTGTAKFSGIVNNKCVSRNMGKLKEHTHSFLDHH